jgi:hypothetical protein
MDLNSKGSTGGLNIYYNNFEEWNYRTSKNTIKNQKNIIIDKEKDKGNFIIANYKC